MYRFFVDKREENKFFLSKEVLNHLKTIHLNKNEKFICVFKEEFYVCILENNFAIIMNKLNENHEYNHNLILFSAIINIKRFEWLIQKATELGVKEFYPLVTKNTNTKLIDVLIKKINRFNEIIKNASEQSFRNSLMKLHQPINFNEAIKINVHNKYIAHEKIKKTNNKQFNLDFDTAFFVGPEGGFDDKEIKTAQKFNVKTISLGKRILRSETAAIFLLSNIIEKS